MTATVDWPVTSRRGQGQAGHSHDEGYAYAVTYTTSVMQVLLGDPVNESTVTMAETIA